MSAPLIDIGINLTHDSYDADRPAVLARARAAGLVHLVITGTSVAGSEKAAELAATDPSFLSATAGVHPDTEDMREPDVAEQVRLAALSRVVAIGETGLDYYRLNGRSVADMEWQRERFRTHIRAA